ncbi:MAG: RNA 2',3'-cyclic phosphodiesterase [Candidatus Omnitrophica bacterium]|nr:RNA 2',3'-cyclic phosphodiesterase [Candidatus Omnitrophota bacterium]
MRAFIGIALPDAVRSSLADLQRRLGESGADVKWVEPEHLHVTLKFLDEITEEQRRTVEEMLTHVAGQQRPFTLGLKQLGAFPSLRAPRIIWVGLEEGREPVVRIAERIEREGQAIGLRREERPVAAHVTLGRVRSPKRRDSLAQRLQSAPWEPPEPFQVTALTLYRSDLHSSGPRYTVLAEIPLTAAAGAAAKNPGRSARPAS